jgi:hypothetical protein
MQINDLVSSISFKKWIFKSNQTIGVFFQNKRIWLNNFYTHMNFIRKCWKIEIQIEISTNYKHNINFKEALKQI